MGVFSMLATALFGAVFSSIIWGVYSYRFGASSLSGMSLFDAGILNVILYTFFICLPIFIIWAVFGFVSQYVNNRVVGRQMFRLFSQMKKNQEYSDLLARIMLETEQNIKNSFVLNRFDLLIGDMNELLSELLQRERMVSPEQIEHLWIKVQNGGKWSFGKVLIENYNRQPSFQKKIFADASSDTLLAGTIMEFCARYQTLLALLEKHDKERIFLNIVETGIFGKVFAVLAPVSDEIRRTRESFAPQTSDFSNKSEETVATSRQYFSAETDTSKGFLNKILSAKKKTDDAVSQKDAFSLALERSFKDDEPFEKDYDKTTKFDVKEPEEGMPEISISEEPVATNTQEALDSLKKEWQEIEPRISTPSDDDLAYPFSGWTDADKYQK